MISNVAMYAGDHPIGMLNDVRYYGDRSLIGDQSTWVDSTWFEQTSTSTGYTFTVHPYFKVPTFLGGEIVYTSSDDEWQIFKILAILSETIDMFVVVNKNDNSIRFTSLDYPEAEAYIHAQKIKEIL